MKKIILSLVIVFAFSAANAQRIEAPNKAEKMDVAEKKTAIADATIDFV